MQPHGPVRPAGVDPNKISVAFQVLYVGPADYGGTADDKKELIRALQSFNEIESRNAEIVRVRPSFLLGLFQVWTKTRESAEKLPWSVEGCERRYEVVELHFD